MENGTRYTNGSYTDGNQYIQLQLLNSMYDDDDDDIINSSTNTNSSTNSSPTIIYLESPGNNYKEELAGAIVGTAIGTLLFVASVLCIVIVMLKCRKHKKSDSANIKMEDKTTERSEV